MPWDWEAPARVAYSSWVNAQPNRMTKPIELTTFAPITSELLHHHHRHHRRAQKRERKLQRILAEEDMKFSHSIQFNAVPDWSSHYISYSNLKKL